MSELQLFPAIILFLSGVIVGVLACLAFNKLKTGSMSANTLKKEKDQYQSDVEAHFDETSKKFKAMATQYQDLYQHLSVGATTLCRPENVAPGLDNKSSGLNVGSIEAKAAEPKSVKAKVAESKTSESKLSKSAHGKNNADQSLSNQSAKKASKTVDPAVVGKAAQNGTQGKEAVATKVKERKSDSAEETKQQAKPVSSAKTQHQTKVKK